MLTRYKRGRHVLLFKVGAPCRDEWRTAAVLSGTLYFGIGERWADVPCLGRRNLAGVEHAGLHSGLGDRDDLGDLFRATAGPKTDAGGRATTRTSMTPCAGAAVSDVVATTPGTRAAASISLRRPTGLHSPGYCKCPSQGGRTRKPMPERQGFFSEEVAVVRAPSHPGSGGRGSLPQDADQ
jgi:hypothetical protein